MNEKITIAIDAMGGENAPNKNIKGLSIFIDKNKSADNFFFNIYGDEIKIKAELDKYKISSKLYKIFNSSSVVSDEETPLTAIKNSKDSSMWNSINSQLLDNIDKYLQNFYNFCFELSNDSVLKGNINFKY